MQLTEQGYEPHHPYPNSSSRCQLRLTTQLDYMLSHQNLRWPHSLSPFYEDLNYSPQYY